jgi:hypothetical protein
MRTPESYEKAEIDQFLVSIGAYVVKPTSSGYGASGHADRLVCIEGVFWAIEVKREGKGPTPLQLQRIAEVHAAGGQATWGTAQKVIPEIKAWLAARHPPGFA